MKFKAKIDWKQWFIIPCIGILDERSWRNELAFSIAFAWLIFRCKIGFRAAKKRRGGGENAAD